MKIAKELARTSLNAGACSDRYKELLRLTDKRDMIKMYLDEIDFCMINDFPNKEYIEKHFKGIIEQYNVHLDDFIGLINPDRLVTLGETSGHIRFDNYAVGRVFVKHTSKLSIKVCENSFVMIDAFDNSSVEIEAHNDAKVCVNRYGNATIKVSEKDKARIKIVQKTKTAY